MLNKICIFCGSSPGKNPAYRKAAVTLAQELINRKIGLVYGGGSVGLMGEIARSVLEAGGEVIGVIPESLFQREVALTQLKDLRVVSSMHARKALMADLADGFIALPGGLGTIEELVEALTWAQLGIHKKPCGLLNICGYFDHLITFLDHAVAEGFVLPGHQALLLTEEDPHRLIERFKDDRPQAVDKAKWALGLK